MSKKNGTAKNEKSPTVEGEGSYTATHHYNDGLAKSIREGRSEELADAAKKALEGPEGPSLREAEKVGKSGHPKQGKQSR